jgi:uncharacterized protein DUF1670
MIASPLAERHYGSARKRFLQSSIERFLDNEFPRTFGPVIRHKLAQHIVALVDQQLPAKEHLRPGQCVWNAVSIGTRADSPRCRLVPVVLTLIDPSDVEQLATGTPMSAIARKAIARLTTEAFQQGALLSMRDIGLLVWREISTISHHRQAWEACHQTTLPHTGSLQDVGTCISHKTTIIRKVVYEGKDPRQVSHETKHSQQAVDRYLKDFYRVQTCYQHNPDFDFITRTTGLSKHLVNQYVQIITQYQKNT